MHRVLFAAVLLVLASLPFGVLSPHAVHADVANPTVSVTPSSVQPGDQATVQGTGFTPNSYAYAYYQRPDGTTNSFNVATDASGTFSFTLDFCACHGTGTEYVTAYDYVTDQWAPYATVAVTSGTTTFGPQVSANPNPVSVDQTTLVTGTGFTPNSWVYFWYQRPDGSTNDFWVYTDSSGNFHQQLGFSPAHLCGNEIIRTYDWATQTWANPYNIWVVGC